MGVSEYLQSPLALETSQQCVAGIHEAVQMQGPGHHRKSGCQKGTGQKRWEWPMEQQVGTRQYRSKQQSD